MRWDLSSAHHRAASWMRTKGRVQLENLPAAPPKRGKLSRGQKGPRKGQTDYTRVVQCHVYTVMKTQQKKFFKKFHLKQNCLRTKMKKKKKSYQRRANKLHSPSSLSLLNCNVFGNQPGVHRFRLPLCFKSMFPEKGPCNRWGEPMCFSVFKNIRRFRHR